MTFCAAIKIQDGLIGVSDTRITSGSVRTTARKVTIHQHGKHSMFLMTSGLRSVRDKALTYFEPELRGALKKGGFLTRDSRVVERKKYGRAKARRSFQFSKR